VAGTFGEQVRPGPESGRPSPRSPITICLLVRPGVGGCGAGACRTRERQRSPHPDSARGPHLLTADSSQAYQWHTLATLSEPGFATDLWTGNACVTGSGRRAVVVYAPREFTNKPQLMEHGAFAAVVDLASGKVTKLPDQVTLAYFNPGCGTDETAVLTQEAGDGIPPRRATSSGTPCTGEGTSGCVRSWPSDSSRSAPRRSGEDMA
jgi:hypothetical protein